MNPSITQKKEWCALLGRLMLHYIPVLTRNRLERSRTGMASAISSAIPNGNSGTGLNATVFRVRDPQASEEPAAQTTLIVPVPEVIAGLVFFIVTENVYVPALPSL